MLIKRITVGFVGLAIAGIVIMGCEKMDGPDPYLDKRVYDQLLFISRADGQTPLGPGVPLDKNSLKLVVINDTLMVSAIYSDADTTTHTFIQTPVTIPVPLVNLGKIIFQK